MFVVLRFSGAIGSLQALLEQPPESVQPPPEASTDAGTAQSLVPAYLPFFATVQRELKTNEGQQLGGAGAAVTETAPAGADE